MVFGHIGILQRLQSGVLVTRYFQMPNSVQRYVTHHRLCTNGLTSRDNSEPCLPTSASALAARSVACANGRESARRKLQSAAGFTGPTTAGLSAACGTCLWSLSRRLPRGRATNHFAFDGSKQRGRQRTRGNAGSGGNQQSSSERVAGDGEGIRQGTTLRF